jgi:hypothetical protein
LGYNFVLPKQKLNSLSWCKSCLLTRDSTFDLLFLHLVVMGTIAALRVLEIKEGRAIQEDFRLIVQSLENKHLLQ